jgi:hypothetical protein
LINTTISISVTITITITMTIKITTHSLIFTITLETAPRSIEERARVSGGSKSIRPLPGGISGEQGGQGEQGRGRDDGRARQARRRVVGRTFRFQFRLEHVEFAAPGLFGWCASWSETRFAGIKFGGIVGIQSCFKRVQLMGGKKRAL